MGKKFDETLQYLGDDYSLKIIDLENVIYRKISEYEIEISGLNQKGKYNATIYLWKNRQIIKSIQDISSKEELSKHLGTLLLKLENNQD